MRAARVLAVLTLPLLVGASLAEDDGAVPIPGDDFVVTGRVKVRPGTYHVVDAQGDGVIQVRGPEARLDLTGVTLVGHRQGAAPDADAFDGVGVAVDDAPGALVSGGAVRGFKVGVRVRRSADAEVVGLDASGNFRQRLRSTVEREDPSDWLWPHENDDGQWERNYGAGIACSDSPRVTVRKCRVRQGQNGLLLQRCDGAFVRQNDFSFNSGWGVALWRTCEALVESNRVDWCVRGYSHGRYARGQDSAAILLFEQCSRNRIQHNSATHSGDGLFLYAGNETLKRTGTGGCNGNVVLRNDFSHAVANGIEATFSRDNAFRMNDLRDCEHGVWAGYSVDTIVDLNHAADCAHGVSIEHGQRNEITWNHFTRCGVAVHLWTDEDPDLAKSAFGSGRDTTSLANVIRENSFERNAVDVRLAGDRNTVIARNAFAGRPVLDVKDDGGSTGVVLVDRSRSTTVGPRCTAAEDATGVFLPETGRGRRLILVDEWGPVDPRETRLFPAKVAAAGEARLSVLGADARWEVTSLSEGFVADPAEGDLPATLVIRRKDGAAGAAPFAVEVVANGNVHRASGTLFTAAWDVRFFRWTKDPREDPAAWAALLAGEPVERRSLAALDFRWQGGAVSDTVGGDRFATLATAEVVLPAGKWALRTVSDDGIRVWVDDRLVVDDWTHHGPTPHDAELEFPEPGAHRVRVEHFELDGWAALSVTFERR